MRKIATILAVIAILTVLRTLIFPVGYFQPAKASQTEQSEALQTSPQPAGEAAVTGSNSAGD
ncbi:MAG TPA: hypothetical protein VE870_14395, partial [Bacteroidales bacterium]|nr:hypothetical protein [Bacteroidales bacterium]